MFDFEKEIAPIKGWLTKKEGTFLYDSARKINATSAIVEIGSWKGKSTVCLGLGARDGQGATIYAIDPHIGSSEHQRNYGEVDTYAEFLKNIETHGVAKFVEPVREMSQEYAPKFSGKIGFLFIDGAHEYQYVKNDADMWFPKLNIGGKVAFHDSWHWPGVHIATAQMLLTSTQIRRPRLFDNITVFEKVDQNSFIDRIVNILFIIYRFFFGIVGFLRIWLWWSNPV